METSNLVNGHIKLIILTKLHGMRIVPSIWNITRLYYFPFQT